MRTQRVDINIPPYTLTTKDVSWKRGDDRNEQNRYNLRSKLDKSHIEGYRNRATIYLLAHHIFWQEAHHMFNDESRQILINNL